MTSRALVWFRRDLRPDDHTALCHALTTHEEVFTVFIFDRPLLKSLDPEDRRLSFIWHSLEAVRQHFEAAGGHFHYVYGEACELIPQLANRLNCQAVYCNEDYEPYARKRDSQVAKQLQQDGIHFQAFRDQVIFAKDEILTQAERPYSVFTPYKKNWLINLQDAHSSRLATQSCQPLLYKLKAIPSTLTKSISVVQNLEELGFKTEWFGQLPPFTTLDYRQVFFNPTYQAATKRLTEFEQQLDQYEALRDYPAHSAAGSLLSVHLRFGTLSIRQAVNVAWPCDSVGAEKWLSELIWREFYQQFLWHYPHTVDTAFKPAYQNLVYPGLPEYFAAWQAGETGYPIIDAGMRQLLQTGFMHNRVRMLCASFLTKHLLVDWRWGEAHFAKWLLDYDQASNVGGWQWSASTGCDAQPYFRIFNPTTQAQKFDAKGEYVRRYVPSSERSRTPIVDHATQRQRALEFYGRL